MTLTPDEAIARLRAKHRIREQGEHVCAECGEPWIPGVGCPTVVVLDQLEAAEGDAADQDALLDRLRTEVAVCEFCGHMQGEPNWCHECGHRTRWPGWVEGLTAAAEALADRLADALRKVDEADLDGRSQGDIGYIFQWAGVAAALADHDARRSGQ